MKPGKIMNRANHQLDFVGESRLAERARGMTRNTRAIYRYIRVL
jgi:hypothetical protein